MLVVMLLERDYKNMENEGKDKGCYVHDLIKNCFSHVFLRSQKKEKNVRMWL